jgi:hypothetical protein
MPRLSVWFVRTSLLYLVLGFTLGTLLLAQKGLGISAGGGLWAWRPAHVELLLIGWTVQLVMGVAYWIFPRFGMSLAARRIEPGAWVAFGLLNGGVWAVALGSALAAPAWLMLAGRGAEVAAVALMVATIWARVRPGLSEM